MSAIAAMSRQRSTMPSALAKTPTETCWYQDEGNDRPMNFRPAGERGHRREHSGEIDCRHDREDRGREDGCDLRSGEGGDQLPKPAVAIT